VRVIVAGGGIGGLATALALHERELADVRVYESVVDPKALGVGINVLPHAAVQLRRLGLLDDLLARGVATAELCFFNRHGQLIWREPRGVDAGYEVPQVSVHRGELHQVLLDAVRTRLGDDALVTGHAVQGFTSSGDRGDGRVGVELLDRRSDTVVHDEADLLIGADGIHSAVRAQLYPDEGPPNWQGDVLWRATTWAEPFLTGRSMFMAGHLPHKFVAYPITGTRDDGRCLVNWIAELDRSDEGLAHREDWNRRGRFEDFAPRFADWQFDWLDVAALIAGADEVFEFPMVDRDPLPRWTFDRVTLLGDAAHPMFPIGSNGASQAIIDALCIADALAECDTVEHALARYEDDRRATTANIVASNRRHGPEKVLDLAEQRAPDGFADVHDVFAPGELEEIAASYKQIAGFVPGRPGPS
jgi:2-polyprenyl-6-methoxyphenol hydroxylase-like FAD-dependent oxidoreductase